MPFTFFVSVHPKQPHHLKLSSYCHVATFAILAVYHYFVDGKDLYKSFLFFISYTILPKFYSYCCITPCRCKDKIHRYHDKFQLIAIPMQSLS